MTAAESSLFSFSDLLLAQTVCEIRYDPAYLLYDRTGAICMSSREKYEDLTIIQATPAGTSFNAGGLLFGVELGAARAFYPKVGIDSREFGSRTASFFEIVLRLLEIPVLSRIGLRQIFLKTFKGTEEAKVQMDSLRMHRFPDESQFGLDSAPGETLLRWESDDYGVMLHIAMHPGSSAIPVIDVASALKDHSEPFKSALTLDVDYYLKRPVLRTQWSSDEWIGQSSHVIKKGLRSLLLQCQTHQQD